jgi:Transposase DDE domain
VGYDAGKKVKGRKLHALVDVEGLPLRVVVHSAGIQDRDGSALVLDKIRQRFPWLELLWADGGYNAHQVHDAVARRWASSSSASGSPVVARGRSCAGATGSRGRVSKKRTGAPPRWRSP